ncbi:hypothetical protein ACPZ19_16880 [Amycolatopsis lurida]
MTSDLIRRQTALAGLRDAVGLWYVDQVGAVSVKNADVEVPEYLEAALHEVGLDFHERDTPAAREAGLRAMAAQTLSHAFTPRKLAGWAHCTFGHDTLELAERLAELDDAYDFAEHYEGPTGDLDAEVMAEARRLAT